MRRFSQHLKAVDLVMADLRKFSKKSAECCRIRRFSHKAAHCVRPADSAKANQRANEPMFLIFAFTFEIPKPSEFQSFVFAPNHHV